MSKAFTELEYTGVFTYEHGHELESLQISHRLKDGTEEERLFHLNGEPWEIVRKGNVVNCARSGDKLMRFERSTYAGPFSTVLADDYIELNKHYNFSLKSFERIADRQAVKLVIEPKDVYRYGYTLWIDTENGLLLKSALLNRDKRILERFQFVRINVGESLPDSDFLSRNKQIADQGGSNDKSNAQVAVLPSLKVNWAPEGFSSSDKNQNLSTTKTPAADVLMYTDGLAVFSVFIERLLTDNLPVGVAQSGGTVAFAKVLEQLNQNYIITVVGEVPLITAERVAQSITMD